jgi:hypothetical protein
MTGVRSWRNVTTAEVDAAVGRQHERAMFAYEAEQDRLAEMVSASETTLCEYAGHDWADAGGLLTCVVCRSERRA